VQTRASEGLRPLASGCRPFRALFPSPERAIYTIEGQRPSITKSVFWRKLCDNDAPALVIEAVILFERSRAKRYERKERP
jgi:hypothetical protein